MIHKLEVDSVQLEFDGRKILSDIYLKCETGNITGLLGRNGQGKTCLMQIIYGVLKTEKIVRIDDLVQYEAFKKPNLISYCPQFNFIPRLLSVKRVFKDFDLDYKPFIQAFPEFLVLNKSSVNSLSAGERRLIEIYIIIKSKSLFGMLDEPFTNLSPIQIEKVKGLLIKEKEYKGLLITDHMFRNILDIADSLYILTNGKTHLTNKKEDIETLGYAKL